MVTWTTLNFCWVSCSVQLGHLKSLHQVWEKNQFYLFLFFVVVFSLCVLSSVYEHEEEIFLNSNTLYVSSVISMPPRQQSSQNDPTSESFNPSPVWRPTLSLGVVHSHTTICQTHQARVPGKSYYIEEHFFLLIINKNITKHSFIFTL